MNTEVNLASISTLPIAKAEGPPVAHRSAQLFFGRFLPNPEVSHVRAVVAFAERCSQFSGESSLAFGGYLRELCCDFNEATTASQGVLLSCKANELQVRLAPSIFLSLLVEQLIWNALQHRFFEGRGGRIAVTMTVASPSCTIAVEDSGVAESLPPSRHFTLARLLLAQLDGEIETIAVIAGTRHVVTIPLANVSAS